MKNQSLWKKITNLSLTPHELDITYNAVRDKSNELRTKKLKVQTMGNICNAYDEIKKYDSLAWKIYQALDISREPLRKQRGKIIGK